MTGPDRSREKSPEHLASLVDRFRKGQAAATAEVRDRVRRILSFRGYGISRDDRFDLEQVILFQVWQAVSRPGFDCRGFWGFVEVLVSRRSIDWLRARKPDAEFEPPPTLRDPAAGPLRLVLDREQAELAHAALERLPEACRELIRLHVGSGLAYGEIARRTGRSEGALRVQMHRCIQRAHQILLGLVAAGQERPRGPGSER